MNYITANQFLKLPEEIQKVFIDWWEIEEGDLIYLVDEKETHSIIKTELDMYKLTHHWYYDNGRDELMMTSKSYDDGYPTIPLFRLDQLWDFIIDKAGEDIEVKVMPCNSYVIDAIHSEEILAWEDDKLQAFWKAAVKVASGNWREE